MEKQKNSVIITKGIAYVISRVLIVLVVIVLIWAAFNTGAATMNVNIVVGDAFSKRATCVLKPTEDEKAQLSNIFTQNFIATDPLLNTTDYENFTISNYFPRSDVDFKIVWPWETKTVVRASEQITDITGTYNITKEEVEAYAMEGTSLDDVAEQTPPLWTNGIYEVTLIKSDNSWKVDSMVMVEVIEPPAEETEDMQATEEESTSLD